MKIEWGPGTDQDSMDQARMVMRHMIECKREGGKVIVGAFDAHPPGTPYIRVEFGIARVLRRCTRQEFLDASIDPESATDVHAPFYFELEITEGLQF